MTADWVHLPTTCSPPSEEILNAVPGINRVLYDIRPSRTSIECKGGHVLGNAERRHCRSLSRESTVKRAILRSTGRVVPQVPSGGEG
ncbi:MAG: hypothetical protein R3F11_16270 [Verrucomicrobiales bacterium]